VGNPEIGQSDLQAIDSGDGATGCSQELIVVALVALRVYLTHTVDGNQKSRGQGQPPFGCLPKKTLVNHGISTTNFPQLVSLPDFNHSTVSPFSWHFFCGQK